MELWTDARIDFLGKRKLFLVLSLAGLLGSVWFLGSRGLNLGIDFLGGTEVELKFNREPSLEELRERLASADLGDVNMQRYGNPGDYEILVRVGRINEGGTEGGRISGQVLEALRSPEEKEKLAAGHLDLNSAGRETLLAWLSRGQEEGSGPVDSETRAAAEAISAHRDSRGGILTDLQEVLDLPGVSPEIRGRISETSFVGSFVLREVDFIGPSAGRELRVKTAYALLGSLGGILVYIWFRFRFLWGLAAVAALVHDVTITLGVLAFTQKEFSLPVVAAILTIIGYSLNDTIVVFDRIRENLRSARVRDLIAVLNRSINQNLSRTVLTSLTTLFAVLTLYLFGGEKLSSLSFALIIGVLVGTYSSIFVASPILLFWEKAFRRQI